MKSAGPVGRAFAPGWDMVKAYKEGRIGWMTYAERYTARMRESYNQQGYGASNQAQSAGKIVQGTHYGPADFSLYGFGPSGPRKHQ